MYHVVEHVPSVEGVGVAYDDQGKWSHPFWKRNHAFKGDLAAWKFDSLDFHNETCQGKASGEKKEVSGAKSRGLKALPFRRNSPGKVRRFIFS
jgi:hypothetical protein